MRIIITGTPGTGKSAIAKALSKKLECRAVNEKDFALRHGIGRLEGKELIVPLEELEKKLNAFLEKEKNAIIEGHLLCELKLKVELCIVLRAEPGEIMKRLEKKKYNIEKVFDNVFCEQTAYCLKHARKNYGKGVLEARSKTIKGNIAYIIRELKKRGLKWGGRH